MTPEELAVLQQILGNAAQLPQPANPNPAPATPYQVKADQYSQQADALDKEAQTPYPQPQSIKERIIAGIQSGMQDFGRLGVPGGSTGQEALKRKEFADANEQRVAQAKALRGEAAQQQQLGQQKDFQTGELENQRRTADIAQQNADRLREAGDNPVGNDIPTGGVRVFTNPHTGQEMPGTRIEGIPKAPTKKDWHYQELNIAGNPEVWAIDPDTGVKDHKVGDANPIAPPGGANGGMQIIQTTGADGKPVYARAKVAGPEGPIKFGGQSVENATAGNSGVRAEVKSTVDTAEADKMLNIMQETYNRIASGQSKAPGADDMVLLSNHIAMTMGSVKGARTGRDIIEAHKNAISADQRLSRAVETVLNGGQLTPDQRTEFVELARRNVAAMHQKQMDLQNSFGGAAPASSGGWTVKR